MEIKAFFDPRTWTLTYLVWDSNTRDAIIIDPVLDFDALNVKVSEEHIDELMADVGRLNLEVRAVLETHAHADHLTGAARIRARTGAPVIIGERITAVQAVFKDVFGLGEGFVADGRAFDRLVSDGETFHAGSITVKAIATPGHTPACMSFLVDDALFTGDALFMPDYGTGRCDFPRGSAGDLWDSVQKLYRLPDSTRVFVGHDYQPGGRPILYETTIGASKRENIQLKSTTSKADYVAFRTARDKTLKLPNLLFQSIQVNIQAGELPPAEPNGRAYLKMPINLFG